MRATDRNVPGHGRRSRSGYADRPHLCPQAQSPRFAPRRTMPWFSRPIPATPTRGAQQGIPQMPHPRGRDRQRAPGVSIRLQAQIELALPGRQPLPRRGLQQLHPGVVMRRPQMVDLA